MLGNKVLMITVRAIVAEESHQGTWFWSKCTKWGWKAKWIIPEHQGHSQF
jgi:hypothetical protein